MLKTAFNKLPDFLWVETKKTSHVIHNKTDTILAMFREQFTLAEARINKPTHTGKGPLEAKHWEGENTWIKKSHFLEHHLLLLIEKV